jgi:predicted transcriptional regulator YheO
MRGTIKNGDRYNYITHTPNGKILRSSTIYLYDEDNNLCGALCINLDITNTMAFETFLRKYNDFSLEKDESREVFATDVKSLLEYLIKEAQLQIGKEPQNMEKTDKIRFLDYLDKKGAFLVTKSSERVCEFLDISKFTLYNYLDLARTTDSVPPPSGAGAPDAQPWR